MYTRMQFEYIYILFIYTQIKLKLTVYFLFFFTRIKDLNILIDGLCKIFNINLMFLSIVKGVIIDLHSTIKI